MTSLVARIPDDMIEALDELVSGGDFASRSDAVREALLEFLDRHRRKETARRIVEGYRRHPQGDDEIEWADEATVAMIAEEPW